MLRPITAADRDAYLSMAHDFYRSEAVDHTVPDSCLERTFDEVLAGSPYVSCQMIEQDGKTAGYVLLAHTWSQEAGGAVLWVEEVYVLPQFRGKGLGTQTFHALTREFPNTARFRLEVQPDNCRARALYEKLGYKPLCYDQMIQDRTCK